VVNPLDHKAMWSDQELEEELSHYSIRMSVPEIQAFVTRCISEGVLRGSRLVVGELQGIDHFKEKENQQ